MTFSVALGNKFSQAGKALNWTSLYSKKNFPVDGQAKQAKSSSEPVNLHSAWS